MRQIVDAAIKEIAINPYRRLHAYPYIASKLEALQRSIAEVGLWPSVIARPLKDRLWRYEMAFGHHRIEAARRSGLAKVPLIVEDLTDKQMLQYMGRENLEDYNAVFLIQLESWEAALKSKLVPHRSGKTPQSIDVARLLGWTVIHSKNGSIQLNHTARACGAVFALVEGGYNSRDDFAGLTVQDAQLMAERALARMEQVEKTGRASERPVRETEQAKRHIGRAVKTTADQVRGGTVTDRDIRGRVDFNAFAQGRKSPTILFAVMANAVADSLKRTLQNDSDAEKLAEIEKVLSEITQLEDWEGLRRIDVELFNLAERAQGWKKRLTPSREKIVQFTRLEGGRSA